MSSRRIPPSWPAQFPLLAGLFLFFVILNGFLTSPFIGWYDSGEMIGATVCLGISHPSGQALFHLLGKIFLMIPFDAPALRLGFLSVFCSALASVLFFILCGRLAERWAGGGMKKTPRLLRTWLLLLTLAWSLSLPWWKYSVTAEVYALHLLLGMMVLWAVSSEGPFKWYLVFFLIGLGTVFRPTQFFALPFAGSFFLLGWLDRPKRSLKPLLFLLLAFVLGRCTFLYLPLRSALHPEIAYADLTHPVPLLTHVFALQFSSYVGEVSAHSILAIFGKMLTRFWIDLTPLGASLIVLGSWLLARARQKIPVFLWVALGWGSLELLLVLTIPFPTFEAHQVLLVWAFSGFLAVPALLFLGEWSRKFPHRSLLLTFLLAVFVLGQAAQVGHLAEGRKERGAQDYARNLLEIMEPNALYMPAEENEYFPVVGYQQSFGFKKGIQVVSPGSEPSVTASQVRECLSQGRTLYVTRKWALPPGWRYEEWGPLFRVTSKPPLLQGRPWSSPRRMVEWGGVGLAAAILSPAEVQAGGLIEIRYNWVRRGESPVDQSQALVGLFVDGEGNYAMRNGVLWLHDIHSLPSGFFTGMKPGSMHEERRILFIPSDFPPGRYRFVVGLQKKAPARREGKESFEQEFDERAAAQNLDKFLGRGENGALVQFAPMPSGAPGEGLWPVAKSLTPLADPRFAPVAELRIK